MKKLKSILAICAVAVLIASCKKEKELNTPSPLACGEIPNSGIAKPFTILSDSTEDPSGGLQCNTKLVEFGPEWKEFISLDPQGSVIWPGADLCYPSIKSGGYTPISCERKPITISVSLPGISGSAGRTLEHPSLSTARTAMNEILQQQIPGSGTPAQISWSQTQIYNEKHFKLAIGGNYGNLFMDINAQFNYNSNSVLGRFLFQFTQVYYSVDCDAPNPGMENFFNIYPSCTQIGGYSPCYVSSIKYGRKVFLMIESSHYDYSAMADIRASFDAFFSSGGVNVNTTLSNLLIAQSVKGVIIGGPSYLGVQVVNSPSRLKDYLLAGANFDMSSPGVPLSYTLRFMKDNSVASIVQYDKFTVRECTIIPPPNPHEETKIISPSDVNELRLYRTGSGDQEFDGHGPKVTVTVAYETRNSKKELWQTINVKMIETDADYTTGERSYDRKVYTAPSGKTITYFSNYLVGNITDTWIYTDIGHGMDYQSFPTDKLMKYIKFLGDTNDDDVTSGSISNNEDWSHIHKLQFHDVKIKYQ